MQTLSRMSNVPDEITKELVGLIQEKLFGEFWPRVMQCLAACDEELLWYRPNEHCNSIGNQVLHLEGNIRQWMVHGVGGAADVRNRSQEFDPNRRVPKNELVERLEKLKMEVETVLRSVSANDMLQRRKIQYFDISVMGVLLTVTEHCSYHLGQITYIIKSQKGIDLGYYLGKDLG